MSDPELPARLVDSREAPVVSGVEFPVPPPRFRSTRAASLTEDPDSNMSRALLPIGVLLLASAAAGGWYFLRTPPSDEPVAPTAVGSRPGPADSRPTTLSVESQAQGKDDELPPEATRKYPPNSFVALRLPKNIKKGVRLPDGSYLPLLNGVPFAAPVKRSEWDGPITPVVGKITDNDGCEWWVHADGSTTTTRYLETTGADGKSFQNTATIHGAKVPDALGVPAPEPGKGKGQVGGPPK